MDTRQLVLINNDEPTSSDWRLDDHTRKIGLDGIAEARRALRSALSRSHDHETSTAA